MKRILAALAALLISSCATPAPQAPDTPSPQMIRLAESTCYFPTCVSYDIEVRPDGHYRFTGHANTASKAPLEGVLPAGAWMKAQAAFTAAHFGTMKEKIVPGELAGTGVAFCINDLPAAEFTLRDATGAARTVVWNTGCPLPEARKLLDDLRTAFGIADLVKKP